LTGANSGTLTKVSTLPKIVNTESKRYELAEVTWRLIAEEGLEATTMRRIAERANCTTGLVTHYFADKEELLIAAVEQVRHAVRERRVSLKEVNPGLPRLREFILTMLPLDDTRRLYWRVWLSVWNQGGTSEVLAKEWLRLASISRKQIRDHMGDALEWGHLRDDIDFEVEVNTLYSLIYGLALDVTASAGERSEQAVQVVDSCLRKLSSDSSRKRRGRGSAERS
jgi:AcrR family transcriptional regulator